jgi:hypothetical protein
LRWCLGRCGRVGGGSDAGPASCYELILASRCGAMSALLIVHAAATWALVGMIWTVQIVHYPLWAEVRGDAFREYHARHMLRMTMMVGPFVVTEFLTAAALLICGARGGWLLVSFAPMVVNWVSTFFVQVPLHAKLAMGFDAEVHRRLLRSNWWRTAGWTFRGVCLVIALASS